mmetsp:Transcript_3721/g.13721  ORF Transcript_3721/g.13721 Transcript_3721/m.13721 type:complete len:275 (-) Transcript_3721:1072-1896(-)
MMRFLSFSSRCISRMVSSMSSRSAWNSLCRSPISCLAACSLFQHFLSLRVLASTSSAMLAYCSSIMMFASSSSCLCSSSMRRASSFSRSSFACAARSSASCRCALLRTSPPISSFSCICFSFWLSAIFSRAIASRSICCARSSSASFFFSSSVTALAASSCDRSSSARFCRLSRSAAALSSSSFIFSSLSPSFTTTFSTIFSTTLVPPGPPAPPIAPPAPPPPLPAMSLICRFSRSISSWNSRSIASFGSSLMRGLFLMFFARLAYRSVDTVSS